MPIAVLNGADTPKFVPAAVKAAFTVKPAIIRPNTHFATTWDGVLNVPADGGYTFHLMDRDGARLVIDGAEVVKTGPPFAPFGGTHGGPALRYNRAAIGLRAGPHTIHVEALNTKSQGYPRLMREGPGITLQNVPEKALMRIR